jgi:hypothetical protein
VHEASRTGVPSQDARGTWHYNGSLSSRAVGTYCRLNNSLTFLRRGRDSHFFGRTVWKPCGITWEHIKVYPNEPPRPHVVVVRSFKVSPAQWLALPEPTRKAKVKGTLRNVWGTKWCEEKRVTPSEKPMLKAFDSGILSWEAHVIECIEWDESFYVRLRCSSGPFPWSFYF